jgi:tRNA threonylcarbamoyladenosine biosynthesis protein TsaB
MPPESPLVLSTIDAQIDQLYGRWLHWVEGSLVPVSEPFIASPETLMIPEGAAELAKSQGITLLGSGCTYRDRFSFADRLGEQRQAARPGAHVMASRGANGSDALEWSRADHLLPRYVQQDVRWKKLSEQGSNV